MRTGRADASSELAQGDTVTAACQRATHRRPQRPGRDSRAERLNTRAAGVVGLAVMCSRVLGLAREQIFAALFGGGRVMDAFTIAFRIPNLLRDLFAEGALSTAFVTMFTRTAALEDDAAAWRLANKVATLAVVTLSAITVLGIARGALAGGGAGAGLRPGQGGAHRDADAHHVSVHPAGVARGAGHGDAERAQRVRHAGDGLELLQSRLDRRGRRARATGSIRTSARAPSSGWPSARCIGGALQLVVQLPALRRAGLPLHADFQWRDPGVRAILRLMGPSVIAASTTQVNVLVNSMFASSSATDRPSG